MPCYSIDRLRPVVADGAYIAPTAVLIGDVHIAAGVYIAPGACLRGDFGRIIISAGANVQDNCVLHGFPGGDTIVEQDGHIGHAAVLHGCRVCENAMVGIGAIVLDNAVIGESAIIGAGAVVTANSEIPPRALAVGAPARIQRQLEDSEIDWKRAGTRAYQHLSQRALAGEDGMVETTPLLQAEPNRPRVEDLHPSLAALAPKKAAGNNK